MTDASAVWVWVGLLWNERVRFALEHYGDRITDVSIFAWSVDRNGGLTETFNPALLDDYRQRWPHIRFWGCFRNMDDPDDGPRAIFDALRDSAAARGHLADQVQSQMFETYPWLYGVDIDMEYGGDTRSQESEQIFQVVADRAHGLGRECSAALPPLTSTGSIGGENWVRYAQLGQILDRVEVMSYDFAWSGSAPGPISPGFWLEEVYDWASSQIDPTKIHMGLPLYGQFWRIHRKPDPTEYRGLSGSYYAAWQMFTGVTPWSSQHHNTGWICYRDRSSQSLWGISDCYDWRFPQQTETSRGVLFDQFQQRDYAVRYGLPSAMPLWSVTDNSVGDAHLTYQFHAAEVIDNTGRPVSPRTGYALTTEVIKRDPVAATIIDDYAGESELENLYTQPDGDDSWAWWQQDQSSYSQFRGSGRLRFANDFGEQALYVLARYQYAEAGTFRITLQGITAEADNTGRVRLLDNDGTELASMTSASRPVGADPGSGRAVLALRVREGGARVYYSISETSIPLALEEDVTPAMDGVAEYDTTGQVWLDHSYLGDGWWYQPREAFEVEVNGSTELFGRLSREGVEWDNRNRFRPLEDVDEPETRTGQETNISQDWVYEHWQGLPIISGEDTEVVVRPADHDLWIGRLMVIDRDGASLVYFSDAQTIVRWRGRADHDWNLAGIALWSIGQEDVRMWEQLERGELPDETKRLNE